MNITLEKFPHDEDWMTVKECALVTIGLHAVNPPDAEWRHKMLVQRHSPIRELRFLFRLEGIPYWLSTELSRHHEGCQPYIKSQRNDRRKDGTTDDRGERRQDALVDMLWSMNAEALMQIANKRLCSMATEEARKAVCWMCRQVEEVCPEFIGVLEPMCVYHGGVCHEMYGCGRCGYEGME